MSLTPLLFLRARPLGTVALVGLLTSTALLVVCNARLPATTPDADVYNATVTFGIAPALASSIALGLLGSRLHSWENLATRSLRWRRLLLAVLATSMALAMVVPSAPRAVVDEPVQVAIQGVLSCMGVGMLASKVTGYAGQASVAFLYGLVGFNTAWAVAEPFQALLGVGAPPSRCGLVVSAAVLAAGLVVQANRSSSLID